MPVWFRTTLFILLVPGAVAGWLPWYVASAPHDPWSASHGAWRLGALLTLIGWAVLLWCARDFAVRGRGTPGPYDPTRALVTSGLYRYVRNPMYVGVLTAVLGQAIWYRSRNVAIYALIAFVAFHAVVIVYEEPTLRRVFGEEYAEYCRRVPRWVPKRVESWEF